MSPSAVYLTLGALADLAGVAVILWWFASRRRLSAETLARAASSLAYGSRPSVRAMVPRTTRSVSLAASPVMSP